ncbi:TonB-dependent receptor [Mucilaginibacter yixingensis]|nr:TonB-dependent receptor [Mucilaginibacter yixingensis]
MSKFILILILISSYQSFSKGFGQSKINLNVQNVTIKKALKEIEKKSDFHFLYNDNLIANASKVVNIASTNATINNVLDDLLKNTNLTYQLNADNLVIISAKDNMAKAVGIKGQVVDEKGQPLPGVTVLIKGSTVGTQTDINGKFSLTIPSDKTNAVLVISFIGYTSQEIEVGNKTMFSIQLKEQPKTLNEVVVIGYGTQRRGDVSSAIASVNVADMNKTPTTNLSTALQGQVPGLVSQASSFKPGSGSSIRIRGNRSLRASNEPLFVVDGIPVSYGIDDINPLDIESIDVQKDAAATAIYGSRGANGVIQVTTKKGKTGKVTVDYSGSTSADNILRKLDVFDGPEYAQFKRDAYIGAKSYNSGLSSTSGSQQYFPDPLSDFQLFKQDPGMVSRVMAGYTFSSYDVSNPLNPTLNALKRPTTAQEKALLTSLGYPVLNEVAVYDPSKVTSFDWMKYGLQTGVTQNHNLSLTGGSEKFSSTLSMGFYKQKGIIPGQDYTRYSISNSNTFSPTKFLTAGSTINFSSNIQNQGSDVYGGVAGQLPLATPTDANGNFLIYPGNDSNIINPLNDVNSIIAEVRTNHLLANVFAQVNIAKGLSFKTTFGADVLGRKTGNFAGAISSSRQGNPANASLAIVNNLSWTLQNQLSYSTTIAKKHNISLTAVQEMIKNRADSTNASATGLTYESQKWYSLQYNSTSTVVYKGAFAQSQQASFLGRAIYSYDSKYILTVSGRSDGSSVLSENNKWKFFPSGSVAWRLDQENFLKDKPWIDQLKLRGGIGSVGNASIPPYFTAGVLSISYYNWANNFAQGYYPSGLPLPDLSWEKTTTKNVGVDFGFLHGRISGMIDVYESMSNEIQPQKLPDASGYSTLLVNLGKVRNRGFEVDLSTVNYDKGGFKWTTDFVFSKNKEAIVEIDGTGNNNISSQWFIGGPVRVYYDYVKQGIFQLSDAQPGGILYDYYWSIPANKTNSALQPGRIRVQDTNGDKQITEADKVVLGSPDPKWTGSFRTAFSYKGLELSAYLYVSHGGLVRTPRPSLVGRYQSLKVNYWTPTNPSNDYPQPNVTSDIPLYWQANSFEDGSFTRVRNILLSYQIPAKWISKIKMRSLSVSVNAVNPFLFSKYKLYDPESVQYTRSYPSSSTTSPGPSGYSYRSLVLGVRAGF